MFDDIIGNDELKIDINRTINRMVKTDWNNSKLKTPKGLLLHGQPGCGKSTILESIINEGFKPHKKFKIDTVNKSNSASSKINGTSEIIDKMFEDIKNDTKYIHILVMDEADDMMMTRGVSRAFAGELTTALIRNIEGVNTPSNFYILATSNYYEHLDPALLDRFSYIYEIPVPTCEDRILLIDKIILKEFEICNVQTLNIRKWAKATNEFTGRDLTRVAQRLKDVEFDIKEVDETAILTPVSVSVAITKERARIDKSISGATPYQRGKV